MNAFEAVFVALAVLGAIAYLAKRTAVKFQRRQSPRLRRLLRLQNWQTLEMKYDLSNRRLYGILDLGYVAPGEALRVASEMLAGGVEILQLRAKKIPPAEIAAIALKIAPICRTAGVPFILNDHPELVAVIGADGVHVGQDDISVSGAREIIGNDKIVGLSTHSLQQATEAANHDPDYIGFGPLFATPTKPDYSPIGVLDISEVHKTVPFPVFCIGGIKLENLTAVMSCGAKRAVIVSGILQAEDIADYSRSCRGILHHSGEA